MEERRIVPSDDGTDAARSDGEENPQDNLSGLDESANTITIADEDYYPWMYELSSSYERYEGYTVIIKRLCLS